MQGSKGCSRERGAAALALIVVLVSAAALSLARQAVTPPGEAGASRTARAIEEARRALLGYAASYPDRVNAASGPGYLPCPAPNARGIAGAACAARTGSIRGRFPWHTLRTNDVRDGSGAPLWYAVSERHRNNPKRVPLSSAIDGDLAVDGEAAVAVVLAPGPALDGQVRAADADAGDYLEAANADTEVRRYARAASPPFNDAVTTITAADLAAVVEPRVLGELARGLRDYASRHDGALPWLVPFEAPPGSAALRAARGRLPVHDGAAVDAAGFDTTLSASWHLDDARVTRAGAAGLLPADCAHRMPCGPDRRIALAGAARCRWPAPSSARAPREVADCDMDAALVVGAVRYSLVARIVLVDADGDVEVRGPTADDWRRRSIELALPYRGPDRAVVRLELSLRAATGAGETASLTLSGDAAARGVVRVAGLRYALDVDAGELAPWLGRNGWLEQVQIAWTGPCAPGGCIALQVWRRDGSVSTHTDVRAVLVAAGPGGAFEGLNAAMTGAPMHFESRPPGPGFDDRVLVLDGWP
ncbi:MAG: hypothetical protein ACU85V_12545 [Gammaproteobacteria bacterium]